MKNYETIDEAIQELQHEIKKLTEERDLAIYLLADWCVSISVNGTGWDDWDECYKTASYGDLPIPCLRTMIDEQILQIKRDWDVPN